MAFFAIKTGGYKGSLETMTGDILPKTNSSPLKIDYPSLYQPPIFRGYMFSGRGTILLKFSKGPRVERRAGHSATTGDAKKQKKTPQLQTLLAMLWHTSKAWVFNRFEGKKHDFFQESSWRKAAVPLPAFFSKNCCFSIKLILIVDSGFPSWLSETTIEEQLESWRCTTAAGDWNLKGMSW